MRRKQSKRRKRGLNKSIDLESGDRTKNEDLEIGNESGFKLIEEEKAQEPKDPTSYLTAEQLKLDEELYEILQEYERLKGEGALQ